MCPELSTETVWRAEKGRGGCRPAWREEWETEDKARHAPSCHVKEHMGGCRAGTGTCLLLLDQFSFGFIFNFCVKMRFPVPLVKTCGLNAVFLVLSEDN